MLIYGLSSKSDLGTASIVEVGSMRCSEYNQKGVLFKGQHTGERLKGKMKL